MIGFKGPSQVPLREVLVELGAQRHATEVKPALEGSLADPERIRGLGRAEALNIAELDRDPVVGRKLGQSLANGGKELPRLEGLVRAVAPVRHTLADRVIELEDLGRWAPQLTVGLVDPYSRQPRVEARAALELLDVP